MYMEIDGTNMQKDGEIKLVLEEYRVPIEYSLFLIGGRDR